MRKVILYILISLLFSPAVLADGEEESGLRYSISGHITDASTGEDLIGASVMIEELGKGSVSNLYGFFSVNLVPGEYILIFSYVGYQSQVKNIDLKADLKINVELTEDIHQMEEVTIRAERRNNNVSSVEMSVNQLPIKSIRRIPTLMGEVDVIKAIQLLPGVQAAAEGSSGFSVRGGNPDQNLILLDEATVYNASHLMGFFSVFNNDAVKDVRLYKGDIPAEYGGRLSSLLDVRMKNGNLKKFSGTGGIGSISSRLTLEGPLVKDKTSFVASGRRTYLDLFLPFAKSKDVRESTLYFYDFNMKVNHIINDNNRLYFSGYFGRDVFENKFAGMEFGNRTFSLRWNHIFSNNLFSNFTLIQSKYDYHLGTPEGEANSFLWESSMLDYGLKADFTWYLTPENTIKFGMLTTYHTFEPGYARGLGEQSLLSKFALPENYALENGIYVSDEQSLGEKIKLKYGLRLSSFHNIGESTVYNYDDNYNIGDSSVYSKGEFFNDYYALEPRTAATYLINERSSLKLSYSRTVQYIHLAQNSTAGTPLDLWFPSSPNVDPQFSDQVAAGYFRNFIDDRLETSVEAYYKKMKNAIDFKDHASLLLNPYMEGELRIGEASSYGLEFLIRKTDGRLNGWISYTLSKTWREVPGIYEGNPYPAPYDKPHDISVVLNYEIGKRLITSMNWVYSTGLPVTFPTGRYEYMGVISPVYSDRNAYRMPDYHRMDVSITLLSKDKPGKKWQGEWNLSVYNAYARKNAWAINFVQDEEDSLVTYAEKTYLFSIVPSLSYNFRF